MPVLLMMLSIDPSPCVVQSLVHLGDIGGSDVDLTLLEII